MKTMETSFLEDIIQNPNDDIPRQIYADWLSEQPDIELQCPGCGPYMPWLPQSACLICKKTGIISSKNRERAELIHTQIELTKLPEARIQEALDSGLIDSSQAKEYVTLSKRVQDLLNSLKYQLFREIPRLPKEVGKNDWILHAGRRTKLAERSLVFERGFPSQISVREETWLSEHFGSRLVKTLPISTVLLSDKAPIRLEVDSVRGVSVYSWSVSVPTESQPSAQIVRSYLLNPAIFSKLSAGRPTESAYSYRDYDSLLEAMDDLSNACQLQAKERLL